MDVIDTGLPQRGDLVLAAGLGLTGRAVVDYLLAVGARVAVSADRLPVEVQTDGRWVGQVEFIGDAAEPPQDCSLVVMSAGIPPRHPLPTAAAQAGVPTIGEVELAWRLDRVMDPRDWLAVTGTNGKTTTTSMLEAILREAGRQVTACGNIGWPVLDAVRAGGTAPDATPDPAERWRNDRMRTVDRQRPGSSPAFTGVQARQDVIVVELSSFQLHWAPSVRPRVGLVLNVAEDHLDWHGGMAAYAAAKAQLLTGDVAIAVVDDPGAKALLEASPAAVRVGVTTGAPSVSGPGEIPLIGIDDDGWIADPVFGGGQLFRPDDLPVPRGHHLTNAMAAAAVATAAGVPASAIRAALTAFRVGAHRAEKVAAAGGVEFVDDSKATNPHAAQASLLAHPRVVWIAGGQLKGAAVDDLVRSVADRLVGVVLLGVDAPVLAQALARHASDVPRFVISSTDDGAMNEVVVQAWALAADAATVDGSTPVTVLLAPAAASLDMFPSYAARGDAFSAAARRIAGSAEGRPA